MKKKIIIFAGCIIMVILGCTPSYNAISICNISEKVVHSIIVYEDGQFTRCPFSPHVLYGFDTTSKNNVHGKGAIYIYIYENEIPNLRSDDLKKYVEENKAISEYSLKSLYANMNNQSRNYVIKDNKIHIMPSKQYRAMQKKRGQ